ncbi:MAG: cell shape-determining protein [Dehalococcoidia bacterium]|nr:MAG: cell shape-determining protein [Dehalococcoidia bacterium]
MMKEVLCYAVGVAEGVTVRRRLAVVVAFAALMLMPSTAFADQPVIGTVAPTSGPTTGGTLVTITGSGFVNGASVVFGNAYSPLVTVVSPTQIVATTPVGSGVGNVTVINPDGTAATTSYPFTFTNGTSPVSITGLSQVTGSAGTATVYITGTGFLPNPSVTIGGITVTSVGLVSSTLIAAVVPTGTSLATATVLNTDGTSASFSGGPTTNPSAQPIVSSVSPSTGSPSGGTVVTITGSGFVPGATVLFGGQPATNVVVVGMTSITAVTPASTAGPVTVLVSNAAGSVGGLNSAFTYTLTAPVLSAIAPSTGFTGGGTAVTLTGTGFTPGATVTFGGLAASNVSVVSSTQIVATTPPGTVGSAVVLVTNPGGLISGLASGFTYSATSTVPPTPPASTGGALSVASVSPSSGPVGVATLVTITGQGFLPGAIVTMGGLPATSVTVISGTQILAAAPTGATAGSVSVVVTNAGGVGAVLPNGYTFTTPGSSTPAPSGGGALTPGSSGLFVFRGGSNVALVTASGCAPGRLVLWATDPKGQWVGYIPTAPAVINLSWDALFPSGIPAGTPIYARCT